MRNLCRDFLSNNGHTVIEAGEGDEAIRWLRVSQGPHRLLVSDVVMPKLSGREFWTICADACPTLKVLFISGYTDDSVVRHGVVEGDVAFLQKPFTMRALADKIREVLDANEVNEYSAPSRNNS